MHQCLISAGHFDNQGCATALNPSLAYIYLEILDISKGMGGQMFPLPFCFRYVIVFVHWLVGYCRACLAYAVFELLGVGLDDQETARNSGVSLSDQTMAQASLLHGIRRLSSLTN